MKINAYVLAADPTWIEKSVKGYYDIISRLVVSYDETGTGWTGAEVDVEQCLTRLKRIDRESKMQFCPGRFAREQYANAPIHNDTFQRQIALEQASDGADWVLQIDTDEIINGSRLREVLLDRRLEDATAVEWPMEVLFRSLGNGRFLKVCGRKGESRYDYPGPVAVRPGVKLTDARRVEGRFVRLCVAEDSTSLQIQRPPVAGETRIAMLKPCDAIVHNSWGRSAAAIRSKIRSWGHHQGRRSWWFYHACWRPAPLIWPLLRDFHPLCGPLWPALKPTMVADE